MSTTIDRTDAGFNLQLKTFVGKIGTYAATFGLTTAQVNAVKADSLFFDYVLNSMLTMQTFAHGFTKYKSELRHGNVQSLGALPVIPTLGTAPAAVAADIEARFRTLIQIITKNANYTNAIGQDLGIAGAETTFDPSTGKPLFGIELTAGGHPKLHYIRGDFDGAEIWKDTGTGFIKLERVTQTAYIDPTPLPAANLAAVWHYKMIFLYKDAVVGSYSDVVSITVNGQTGANPTTGTTPAPSNQ